MLVLISSPEHDTITRYLRIWSRRIVNAFEQNHTFKYLEKEDANSKKVCGFLSKKQPDLVLLHGHGGADCVCGHNDQKILTPDNISLLKNTTTYALSCNTAKTLGPLAVKNGARAYIGYDEPFIMFCRKDRLANPLDDDTANLFLKPAFRVDEALLENKTPEQATMLAKQAYDASIKQALNSDIQSSNDRCVDLLLWDQAHLICCQEHNE